MKILAVSDMHGRLDNALLAIDKFPADLLLCCGDWGDPGELDPAALNQIVCRIPVLSVYGNHDDVGALSETLNSDGTPILLRNGEIRDVLGLRITGISGIWAKSHRKPYYITDEEVDEIARGLSDRGVDILITHGCPVGLADTIPGGRRGGQRCFLDAFHTVSPRLYLCGHLHAAQTRELKDGRLVVNVGHTHDGDYWTIDFDDARIVPERHRL